MAHRKWKETKLQPGTARPGNMPVCCLVYFHFLWAILCPQAVDDPQPLKVSLEAPPEAPNPRPWPRGQPKRIGKPQIELLD